MTLAGSFTARVDDRGLHLRDDLERPLAVELDGRYVWATTPRRDGRRTPAGVLVAWPEALRPFLDGRARVTLRDAASDVVVHDADVAFGSGDGAVRVEDARGNPLAVDKVGHLCRAFEDTGDDLREEVLSGAERALTDLREVVGVEAFLNYGALLGAVRDGAMIGSDSDVDLCYASSATSPVDVVRESHRIERALRRLGWACKRMSGGDIKLFLPLSDGRTCHIDVFAAFWIEGVFYQLGNRSGSLPRSAVLPVSTVRLHGHDLPAPADPEAMLAFLYGPQWRIPDPSFAYDDPRDGVRRLDGWLRGFRTHMGDWTGYFADHGHRVGRSASEFAHWVDGRLPPCEPIAEIGPGTGGDALFLAGRGRPVRTLDFSQASRGRLTRRARRRGQRIDVRTVVLGELRTTLVAGAELAREPHHVIARNLLGCLDDEARAQLWLLARMATRGPGTSLLLEFSATSRRPLPQPGPRGLVRRLDPARIVAELEALGARVDHCVVIPGHDADGTPDPAVCRLAAHWPHPDTAPEDPMPSRTTTSRARRVLDLPGRLRRLEDEVQENRRLHRRVAELTDVVAELLVPIADRDEEKVRQLLEVYRREL